METKVVVLNQLEMEKLKKTYEPYLKDMTNPHYFFYAKKDGMIIEAYKTGKVVIRGNSENDEADILIKNYSFEVPKTKVKSTSLLSSIGSDEVGTGDVFGPIVVCSFFAPKESLEHLKSIGVQDSKKLNDPKIIEIARAIKDKYTFSLLILNNEKFNTLTKSGLNMNVIKAKMHNKAILNTINKCKQKVTVIVDQFCEPKKYFSYLENDKIVYKDIIFKTQAESLYLSVAAASIMARYAFLQEMDKLSRVVGINLQKGASSLVDKQLRIICDKEGFSYLNKIAKTNFQNIKKLAGDYNE